MSPNTLRSGREVCPSCKRKGLGYAPHPHPHALGWVDYNHAECRYCQKRFKLKLKVYMSKKVEVKK